MPGAKRLGGAHFDSAVLKDQLQFSGVVAAHTKKPLSEAYVFGVAGGIATGYSCVPMPSSPGLGSGMALIGRNRAFLPDGKYQAEFYRRIEVKALSVEEPDAGRAAKNLAAALKADRPVVVWCSPLLFPHQSWTATAGLATLLVHAIDKKTKKATVSDGGPRPFKVALDDLEQIRGRVNPAHNRILVIDPPKKLEKDLLGRAAMHGVRACLALMREPPLPSHDPFALAEAATFLANPHHSKSWHALFPGSRVYLPLVDLFQSIETAWTGGGFFRPLFADFLDEAAALTRRKELVASAAQYRKLGKKWSELADAALPRRYQVFKKTRETLIKVEKAYRSKGAAANATIVRHRAALAKLEEQAITNFPMDGWGINKLLDEVAARLADVARDEGIAARELFAAAR